jgi:hypothetical protein
VKLLYDTSRTVVATVVAATETRETVDGHPHVLWVSDDEDPIKHHDEHDAELDDEDPEPVPGSPDELAPMEFDIDDLSRA